MNVLVIMSDEHSNNTMGCMGHTIVKTPNLDQLAEEGAVFTNAYTNCPVCTPARASFLAGRYVHELGTWDNSTPYDGQLKDLPQHLAEHGQAMYSFGKLDLHPEGEYEGLIATYPGHRNIVDIGAFFRETGEAKPKVEERYQKIGIREGINKDQTILAETVQWLKQRSGEQQKDPDKPWFLYVGFLNPHFPFYVKQEHWDYYDKLVREVPTELKRPFTELNEPLNALRHYFRSDLVDENTIRRMHVGYYALTNELDDNVGTILQTLKEEGMYDDTLIIYTSDHGEQLGRHGLWFKCCMYEETANIPLIMKGPSVTRQSTVMHPVSLVDIYPTVCDALGVTVPQDVPGRSLLKLAAGLTDEERNDFVFSEYHGHGIPVGMYMIRWKQWKYVYYTGGYAPQLFDVEQDPEEMTNLADASEQPSNIKEVLQECHSRLLQLCDPEETEERAKAFQAKTKKELGIESFAVGDPSSSGFVDQALKVPHPEPLLTQA
jgi:choline-sulfatase